MDAATRQIQLGPEGIELKREALRFCRAQPEQLDSRHPFEEERRVRTPRAEHLSRLAIALDDLDLAREISLAGERTNAEARILKARDDSAGLRRMIALTEEIEDRTLHGQTVRGLVEAELEIEWLLLLVEPVGRVDDWQLRDRLRAILAEGLNDPVIAYRILDDETRIKPLSRIAGRSGRVDLARDALGIARKIGNGDLLLSPFAAAPHVGDEDFLRRCLGIAASIHDFELAIIAMDLLGDCDFRNDASRRAYRMIQTLPEFEPDEDDDGLWEGSRDIPLAHLALRHRSITLARRVNGRYFRDLPISVISMGENNLELAAEISDEGTRALARTSIALDTRDFDLLDRILIQCSGRSDLEHEWFGAAVAMLTLLRRHGSRQLCLPAFS